MSPARSLAQAPSIAIEDEPTPKPASAVGRISPAEPGRCREERDAALLAYFANPTAGMRAMDAAWEEALARYGDEDSEAWILALEDGTHPLCHVAWTDHSA